MHVDPRYALAIRACHFCSAGVARKHTWRSNVGIYNAVINDALMLILASRG